MRIKASLVDICGGNENEKAEFLKLLDDCVKKLGDPIDQAASYKLATISWKNGFNAYHRLVMAAVKKGDIEITMEHEGTTYRFIANR